MGNRIEVGRPNRKMSRRFESGSSLFADIRKEPAYGVKEAGEVPDQPCEQLAIFSPRYVRR